MINYVRRMLLIMPIILITFLIRENDYDTRAHKGVKGIKSKSLHSFNTLIYARTGDVDPPRLHRANNKLNGC